MFKTNYTRHLETEVERLRTELRDRTTAFTAELAAREVVFREEIAAAREAARADVEYGRSLVSSVLLKNGMYTAAQIAASEDPDVPDGIPGMEPYRPLAELQAEAERDEITMLLERMQAEVTAEGNES